MVLLLYLYLTTGKTVALTRWTFVGKGTSLYFNMLSRFVTAFLPRSKHLLISWLQSPSTVILEPKSVKFVTFSILFPIYLPWSDGTGWHNLCFCMLSFNSAFSLSSFTFIKALFSSSLLSSMRVVSSIHLRLLISLPAILIQACESSSLAFSMMCSVCTLNKQGDSVLPWCTPFPVLNQFICPCLLLTIASWPACRFLRRQARWSGFLISLRFPVCCHPPSQRLEHSQWSRSSFFFNSFAFSVIQHMLAIWTLITLRFLNPTCTSESSWFTYCWSLAWRILSIILQACEVSATVQ